MKQSTCPARLLGGVYCAPRPYPSPARRAIWPCARRFVAPLSTSGVRPRAATSRHRKPAGKGERPLVRRRTEFPTYGWTRFASNDGHSEHRAQISIPRPSVRPCGAQNFRPGARHSSKNAEYEARLGAKAGRPAIRRPEKTSRCMTQAEQTNRQAPEPVGGLHSRSLPNRVVGLFEIQLVASSWCIHFGVARLTHAWML